MTSPDQVVACTPGAAVSNAVTHLLHLEHSDSTQDEVRRRLAGGFIPPFAVRSDSQRQGRGRAGESWQSPTGNLYLSAAMGPFPTDLQLWLPTLSWHVSDAVCSSLVPWELHPRIKWPNDLLIGDRKVGGILIETEQSTHHGTIAIVGIGLNISTAPDVSPPGLQSTRLIDHISASNATKLLTPAALAIDLVDILFADAPATFLDLARNQRRRALYLGRLAWVGEWVRAERDGHDPVTGVLTDVDDAGGLQLYNEAGETVRLTGGVRRLRRLDGQGANDVVGD